MGLDPHLGQPGNELPGHNLPSLTGLLPRNKNHVPVYAGLNQAMAEQEGITKDGFANNLLLLEPKLVWYKLKPACSAQSEDCTQNSVRL